MNRSWAATTAVIFLGLTFLDDVLPEDLGIGRLSALIDGTVATGEAPTKAIACEQAVQTAMDKTTVERRSEITSKTCSCSQRASTVETWTCVASVRWTKGE